MVNVGVNECSVPTDQRRFGQNSRPFTSKAGVFVITALKL